MKEKNKRISVWLLAYFATWLVIPHVLFARKRPASTLAWIWSIIAVPFVGPLAYFALGADRMQRKHLKKAARLGLLVKRGPRSPDARYPKLENREEELLRTLGEINQIPFSTARTATLLFDAAEFYPALKEHIDKAQHHVHLEFFIWRDDDAGLAMLGNLVAAARRGVHVRLLLDQVGCLRVSKSFFKPLVDAGGEFSWFYSLPLWRHSRFMNLRNHRKLQIIDGKTAFVGGMNIGSEHVDGIPGLGPWRDAQLMVEGRVVRQLQRIFAEDWFFATDKRFLENDYMPKSGEAGEIVIQIISGGPDLPREPIPKSILTLLMQAKKRVWLTTGYFAPNQMLLTGLQLCAARGVDVRLLVSEKSDHPYLLQVGRSYYEDLLEWKVRVYEYSEGLNHKKAMLFDDGWLMVGSANSDNRSMRLNFELNLLARAPEQAAQLEAQLLREFEISREIGLDEVRAKTFPRRLMEAALRPLAPIL